MEVLLPRFSRFPSSYKQYASCGEEYDAGATMERSTAIEAGRWVTTYRCAWCTGANGSKRALARGASAKVVDRNALVRN